MTEYRELELVPDCRASDSSSQNSWIPTKTKSRRWAESSDSLDQAELHDGMEEVIENLRR